MLIVVFLRFSSIEDNFEITELILQNEDETNKCTAAWVVEENL